MAPARRTLLRTGMLLGTTILGGCLEGSPGSSAGTRRPDETEATEVRLWLREASLPESDSPPNNPIVYSELPQPQQEIVQTGIDEGSYSESISEMSKPLERLRSRIEVRAEDDVEAFVKRGETYYGIGFVEGDHIIAHP